MNLTEQNSSNQQLLLVSSSSIDNGNVAKTRRSSSILTVIEPIVLVIEEEEGDDGETTAASKSFPLSGILYGLLGSLLFVTGTFIIKELQVDLLDALIIRFIVQISLFGIFVIYHHYPVWVGSSKEKWLQFVLCILNGFIFFGYFISVRYLPLPDLTTLNFTRLLWTVAFGILIYKEKPTMVILLAVCLTLIGVVFVAQPTFLFKKTKVAEAALNMTPETLNGTNTANTYSLNSRMIGISLSLATGLLSAFNLLIFKQLITLKLKPSVLILQHSFVFLLCLILNQFYKYFLLNDVTFFTLTIFQWKYWLATLTSLLQILAIISGNRAVKREPPSIVTVVSASDIIYAILLQNTFTKKRSNLWILLGSALVISSVLLIGVHKFVQERKTKKKKIKNGNSVKN
jgi:drug/metabolite transporter (DMT)-like permease